MTGNEIYKSAVSLIGGDTVCTFECDESLSLRSALNNINLLLADLAEGTKIESLNDEIQSDATVTGALPYGVAMLMCTQNGYYERQGFFAEIYSSMRAKCKNCVTSVKDVMPKQVVL